MKVWEFGGQRWDKEALTSQRESIIQLRDAALTAGMMDWAVIISHEVAILAHVIEELEG